MTSIMAVLLLLLLLLLHGLLLLLLGATRAAAATRARRRRRPARWPPRLMPPPLPLLLLLLLGVSVSGGLEVVGTRASRLDDGVSAHTWMGERERGRFSPKSPHHGGILVKVRPWIWARARGLPIPTRARDH